jgi:hypothetical protein
MRVKALVSAAGLPGIRRGVEYDLPDSEAENLISVGFAEKVSDVPTAPRGRQKLDAPTGTPVENLTDPTGQKQKTPEPPAEPKFGGKPLSYFKDKTDEQILTDKSARVGKPTLAKIRAALGTVATVVAMCLALAIAGCSTSGQYYETTKGLWQDDIGPSYREYVAADATLDASAKHQVLRSADMFDKAIRDEAHNQTPPTSQPAN